MANEPHVKGINLQTDRVPSVQGVNIQAERIPSVAAIGIQADLIATGTLEWQICSATEIRSESLLA